ncbi:MAG: MBL fold metallo-hydrolase [Blautia marasmi]
MLIDGGNRKASSFVVSYLKRQNVEALDYILISHFDEDHLAGAIGALYQFPAGKS